MINNLPAQCPPLARPLRPPAAHTPSAYCNLHATRRTLLCTKRIAEKRDVPAETERNEEEARVRCRSPRTTALSRSCLPNQLLDEHVEEELSPQGELPVHVARALACRAPAPGLGVGGLDLSYQSAALPHAAFAAEW